MGVKMSERMQTRLESITRRWWFFMLMVLIQFIPPFTSKGYAVYDSLEAGWITGAILSRSIVYDYAILYPFFKIVPIILVLSIIMLGNRASRAFSIYTAITYVLFAFLQNIAITDEYGLGILTVNVIMFLLVAAFWFWEAFIQKNDFTPQKRPLWKYWVIPVAVLAYWYPVNPITMMPDFTPIYVFTNMAGLAFCLMTPVYLAILALYHPQVDRATLRITSLVGLIIAFYNILVNFIMFPGLWWNGILHIPLISLSIYALAISIPKNVCYTSPKFLLGSVH